MDSETTCWSEFILVIWPFPLIKKWNIRQRTAKMLNKTPHYSSQFKQSKELECISEEWQRKRKKHESRYAKLFPPFQVQYGYIHMKEKKCGGNRKTRKVWDGSLLSGGQEWLSVIAICWEPWCSVTSGRWPKGMKMAPDSPVIKEYVLFDVLLLIDLDAQNFSAGARP